MLNTVLGYLPGVSFLNTLGSWFGYVGQPRIRTAPDPGGGGGGGGGGGVPAAFRPESYQNLKLDPNSGYDPIGYAFQAWKKATRPGGPQWYMRPYQYGYGSSYVNYPIGYVGGAPTVGQGSLSSLYIGGLLAAAGVGLLVGAYFIDPYPVPVSE